MVTIGAALLVAVIVTWPLPLHLGSMAHDPFDSLFQAWTIDWVQHALTSTAPLWDANIFAPDDNTLAYSDSLIGVAVPLLPLRLFGLAPIALFNVAFLIGIATSAGGGYAFGRIVTGDRAVGAVTAAAFAFGTFGAASAGHLHAVVHAGIGTAAAGAWWLADRARRDEPLLAPASLLAGSVVWQMSVSVYPGAYSVVAVLVVLAVRWRDLWAGHRRGLRAAAGALAISVGATLVLAIPYLQVLGKGGRFVESPEEIAGVGIDFTRVSNRLVVWGPLLSDDRPDGGAFPGVTLLLLAAVGAVSGLRALGRRRRAAVTGLVFVAVGAFMGLGTAAEGWRAYSPYRLLFELVPGVTVIRATARAWILGLLGLGLLAGMGCVVLGGALGGRRPRRGVAVVAALAVLGVVVEGYEPWTDRPEVAVSAADEALAADPRGGGVLYLPALWSGGGLASLRSNFGQNENVYGTTKHHRATPNGYSGIVPDDWKQLSSRMRELPSPSTLVELRSLEVRFVVVRAWAGGSPWEALLDPSRAAPLRLLGRYDGDLLYEVPDRFPSDGPG